MNAVLRLSGKQNIWRVGNSANRNEFIATKSWRSLPESNRSFQIENLTS